MKRHKVPDPKSSHWQLKQQSLNTWAVWGCRKEVCWHCMKIYKHLEQLEIQPGLSFQNRWWNWRDPEGPLEHIPAPLCHQCYKSCKDKLQKKWRLTIGTSHKAEVFSSFCPLPHFTEGTIRERWHYPWWNEVQGASVGVKQHRSQSHPFFIPESLGRKGNFNQIDYSLETDSL